VSVLSVSSVPYAKAIASGSGVAAGWATAPPTITWAAFPAAKPSPTKQPHANYHLPIADAPKLASRPANTDRAVPTAAHFIWGTFACYAASPRAILIIRSTGAEYYWY
jgi:hypothetical protein